MSTLTIGYWNIRGYAQPIRLLLEQAGVDYKDIRYNFGPGPEWSRDEWLNVKFTLGFDFSNVPFAIDGDVKLTQSLAVIRYLGRKYQLAPVSEKEQQRVDLVEQQILDWRSQHMVFYTQDDHQEYKSGLKDKVAALSKFLGNRDWLSGGGLTYVDFLAYEWLDVNRLFHPQLLTGFTNLEQFVKRFESLPNVAKYMKSDRFIKWPINGPMAKWGGATMKAPK